MSDLFPRCLIETIDLWRVYKSEAQDIPALRGVNLRVEAGQFLALKGRSGSGKTTLLNCLAGLDRPTRGSVHVLGVDITTLNDNELTGWRREQLGLVFQSFSLLPSFSAFENVELMLRLNGGRVDDRRRRAMECLELVALEEYAHHRPYELSGGQQQRVAIARALANQPQLIMADEPTGELDSATTHEILSLFRRLVDQAKVTLLMVSHDILVDGYASQVLYLKDGLIHPE